MSSPYTFSVESLSCGTTRRDPYTTYNFHLFVLYVFTLSLRRETTKTDLFTRDNEFSSHTFLVSQFDMKLPKGT